MWVDGVTSRPVALLPDEATAPGEGPAYVYVNGRQLAVPDLRRTFEALSARVKLREVAQRTDAGDRFFLLAVEPAAPSPPG